ncbi:MAG TPA: GNAT family N-acetyltransferase [Gaiellaceae bacterium]|nr:GNAT family N-acetyltransferase [Gaiellaceae bacterium]
MEIRRATVDDASGIADVHVRTWQEAYEHVFGAERLAGIDASRRRDGWERNLAAGEHAFVAEEDGRIVAFVSVGAGESEGVGELFAIYALPEAWGSGAGTALMRAGLATLRDLGYREAVLWVLDDNPRARRFYEREGWMLDGGTKEGEFLGLQAAEVRYRITL